MEIEYFTNVKEKNVGLDLERWFFRMERLSS